MNQSEITAFGGATYKEGQGNSSSDIPMKLDEYLLAVMGPKQMANHVVLILVTIFYLLIYVSGVVGNLSVCLVIFRSPQLHSAMNYYLVSLAVADLTIIMLGLPNELSIYWHQYPYPFGEAFCKIRSFLSESASYANVLTILSFSLERYLAICRPLYVFPLSDLKRAVLVSSLCWAVAMLASIPHLLFTRISYIDFPWQSKNYVPESAFCAMMDENIYPQWYPVHEMSFIVFFLIPVILLTFLYISMVKVIRQAGKNNIRKSTYRGSGERGGPPKDNRKQIIRMLISVVILFFVSWFPFHFQRLGYVYFKHLSFYRTVNQILFYLSGCFYFLSSTLNPILYNVMSAKYRHAFKTVVFCIPPERPPACPMTTFTSTTNLLTSSYIGIHLKDFLDSRRNSKSSNATSTKELQRNTSFARQNRSSSLCTNLIPPHTKTNLSRQTSFSDTGDKICPRSGFLSPPSIRVTQCSPQSGLSPFNSFPTLVEEKEESST